MSGVQRSWSEAFELIQRAPFEHSDDTAANAAVIAEIRELADHWSSSGHHFLAGYAHAHAVHLAWGDLAGVVRCTTDAIREFSRGSAEADSLEAIACLKSWTIELGNNFPGWDPDETVTAVAALNAELAQRVVRLADASACAGSLEGLLVRGFELHVDSALNWQLHVPQYEVSGTSTRFSSDLIRLEIPSAFQLFVRQGDYVAADVLAQRVPEAFTTFGVRGWRSATQGFLDPASAAAHFAEAAAEFARDIHAERTVQAGGSWSSINRDLWAKYFRARAEVAAVVADPALAREKLGRAVQMLDGTSSGWVNPQVTCFRVLVTALNSLLTDRADRMTITAAKESLEREAAFHGLRADGRLALQFLDGVATAFEEFQSAPERALVSGTLPSALDVLGRIPLIGSDLAAAVSGEIGKQAMATLLGQQQTWIYRTLESVTDESVLRQILYRLMQAELPRFAQVRHGPIEYGKDIVALVEDQGRFVLRMYQAKAGDITKRSWPAARQELEEMFQVPMSRLQLPESPADRIGVLIFNGHVNTYAEPVVEGWLNEQAQSFRRTFEIMHLDDIVTWIVERRLVNELRLALAEFDVPVVSPVGSRGGA